MANNGTIRWRLQFVSKNGTGCLVNIYDTTASTSADPTKTGADVPFAVETGVTQLIGAAEPFYYEEDDDENLLTVYRIKTGYISVIEDVYGTLDNLVPPSPFSRYVEFYYGTNKVFDGFIQQQTNQRDYAAGPAERQFPIVSKLGAIENIPMPIDTLAWPNEDETIRKYLEEILTNTSRAYNFSHIVFPDHGVHENPGTSSEQLLRPTVKKSLLVEKNGNFSIAVDNTEEPYKAITIGKFIEGICNLYGCIAHETPETLIFAKYDHDGVYKTNQIANNYQTNEIVYGERGDNEYNLNANNEICDDSSEEQTVLPVRSVDISFSGSQPSSAQLNLDLSQMTWYDPILGLLYGGVFFYQMEDKSGCIYSPQYVSQNSSTFLDNYYYLNTNGVAITYCKFTGQDTIGGIGIQARNGFTNYSVKLTFPEHPALNSGGYFVDYPRSYLKVKVSAYSGISWNTLAKQGKTFQCKCKVSIAGVQVALQTLTVQNGEAEMQVLPVTGAPVQYFHDVYNNTITVELYDFTIAANHAVILIDNVTITSEIQPIEPLLKSITASSHSVGGNPQSQETASVQMLFNATYYSTGKVWWKGRIPDPILSNEVRTRLPLFTKYAYMFQPQKRLQLNMEKTAAGQYIDIYTPKFTVETESGLKFRVISEAFYPRDDQHTYTLQSSPIL